MNKVQGVMSQLRIGHRTITLLDGAVAGVGYVYKSLLANQPTYAR